MVQSTISPDYQSQAFYGYPSCGLHVPAGFDRAVATAWRGQGLGFLPSPVVARLPHEESWLELYIGCVGLRVPAQADYGLAVVRRGRGCGVCPFRLCTGCRLIYS